MALTPRLKSVLNLDRTRTLTNSAVTSVGEYTWVVGPPEAMGMGLGLTYRGERQVVTAKLDVRPLPLLFATGSRP